MLHVRPWCVVIRMRVIRTLCSIIGEIVVMWKKWENTTAFGTDLWVDFCRELSIKEWSSRDVSSRAYHSRYFF